MRLAGQREDRAMRWLAVGMLCLGLAGCSDGDAPTERRQEMMPVLEVAMDAAASDAGGATAAANDAAPAAPAGRREIAYRYGFTVWLPAASIEALQKRHLDACLKAGPAVCQVMASDVSRDSADEVMASLQMRMRPDSARSYRTELEKDLASLDGELRTASINAEDLTRQIVDLEARLRAQSTLRDRLQALIADRPGKLADLLETERELARVQQELDSATSTMAVFRERVDMSEVRISYESRPVSVADRTFEPIADALRGAVGTMVGSLAVLITVVAGLLPILMVLALLVWLFLRWRRKRKAARAAS
jgi:hypothetical protein